ncbi:MAG: DUF1127 domain-containing protein [Octadecabacter sp.]
MTLSTTNTTTTTGAFDLWAAVQRPFKAVFNGMITLAESDSRLKAVRKLQEISDEELATLGLDRQVEIRRIFGASL